MQRIALLIDLFIRFVKIGLVGFGGGWAILPIIQREIVEDAHYLSEDEFYNLVAIAGSTPGPVAVNAATYVGFKTAGLPGAVIATLGVVLPPFTIISFITYSLTQFLDNRLVQAVLKGLKAAIIALIIVVLYSTFKASINGLTTIQVLASVAITLLVLILVVYFRVHPIMAILLAGFIGLILGVVKIW